MTWDDGLTETEKDQVVDETDVRLWLICLLTYVIGWCAGIAIFLLWVEPGMH